jgi:hypothetical protein
MHCVMAVTDPLHGSIGEVSLVKSSFTDGLASRQSGRVACSSSQLN